MTHTIKDPKEFDQTLTKLLTSDLVHADTFNPSFDQLINNDAFLKEKIDAHLLDYVKHGELIAFPGYYIEIEFDTPTEGDITETMKKSSDHSVFLTRVTEFDKPTEGDITTTIECAVLGIHNKVVTEFDTPTAGDITETASEVSV